MSALMLLLRLIASAAAWESAEHVASPKQQET